MVKNKREQNWRQLNLFILSKERDTCTLKLTRSKKIVVQNRAVRAASLASKLQKNVSFIQLHFGPFHLFERIRKMKTLCYLNILIWTSDFQ